MNLEEYKKQKEMLRMKIIDLLNKIANGEEVPKKIKYKNKIYERYQNITTNNLYYYQVPNKNDFLIYQLESAIDLLDEVEILEEPKKIEKIARCDSFKVSGELYKPTENQEILRIKVNELIDEINNLKEND